MYFWLKSFHLLGMILFLGNIVVTACWKLQADKSRNPTVIAFGCRLVIFTDWIFTLPGAILLAASGYANAGMMGRSLVGEHWLLGGQLLFFATGIIWMAVLIPTQRKQSALAREFGEGQTIPEAYWRLASRWKIFGYLTIALAVIALFLMVFKPAF